MIFLAFFFSHGKNVRRGRVKGERKDYFCRESLIFLSAAFCLNSDLCIFSVRKVKTEIASLVEMGKILTETQIYKCVINFVNLF